MVSATFESNLILLVTLNLFRNILKAPKIKFVHTSHIPETSALLKTCRTRRRRTCAGSLASFFACVKLPHQLLWVMHQYPRDDKYL